MKSRRRELDPGGRERANLGVAGMQAYSDEPVRHDEILDAPVRLQPRPQRVGVDARDEKVGVLRLEAEELVADGAADEIRVQPERADVVLDRAEHLDDGDRFDLDERA